MQDSFAWRARSAVFIIAESCDLVGDDDAIVADAREEGRREGGERREKEDAKITLPYFPIQR